VLAAGLAISLGKGKTALVIIDLQRFIAEEGEHWRALEAVLDRLERDPSRKMGLEEVGHFQYLYQRASADLARIMTFSAEQEIHRYLDALVSRAYAEIHETREKSHRVSPLHWFFNTLPRTFRRHIGAFWLSLAITFAGLAFGGLAVGMDPGAKEVIMPFSHLQGDPSERVEREEQVLEDRLEGVKMTGAAWYMTHNTRVSILTMMLGISWGIGTVVMLFYNGVILGAVAVDYVLADEAGFLLAWLSPHGAVEIPAIVLAGQAGLVLAGTLIGWGRRAPLGVRLKAVSGDLVTLFFGVAVLLIWAGIVEAFVSQYHEPFLPYTLKAGFGAVEFLLLVLFLGWAGRKRYPGPESLTDDGESHRVLGHGPPLKKAPGAKASTLVIRTPEGITFSMLLAGPVTRLLAWAIDLFCILAVSIVLNQALSLLVVISQDLSRAFYMLTYFLVSIGYGIAAEWHWRGQTVGKRLLRLRVMDAQGLRLRFSQIVIRNLMRFVDSLPAFYLVGGAVCLVSRHAQRLGDFAANTIVVRNPKVAEPDLDRLMSGKYNSLREYPHLGARLRQRVTPREAGIALQALIRRNELDPLARVELFERISSHFRAAVEFPEEATHGVSAEQYVSNVVDILFRDKYRECEAVK
jgi:uncharacterized membrane protein SpoIIM required for sporulation/uncharacterized RDD family membrane protein YckC